VLAADSSLGPRIATGGDDYEVLAAVPASNSGAFQSMAAQAAVAVARIGVMLSGSGTVIEGHDGQPVSLDRAGWDHF
jgi:thiamine-monophosphate kinase